MSGKRQNPYVPKYITTVPWYHDLKGEEGAHDYLAHHRNKKRERNLNAENSEEKQQNNQIDGQSIKKNVDDYDIKRDRWYGFQAEEWDEIAKNWDKNKLKANDMHLLDDSDDTDYELEIMELDLKINDLKNNIKEAALENTARNRKDVPAYILKISVSEKLDYKKAPHIINNPDLGFVNDPNQFKRKMNDGDAHHDQFAWEKIEAHGDRKRQKLQDVASHDRDTSIGLPQNSEVSGKLDLTLSALQRRHENVPKLPLTTIESSGVLDTKPNGSLDSELQSANYESKHEPGCTMVGSKADKHDGSEIHVTDYLQQQSTCLDAKESVQCTGDVKASNKTSLMHTGSEIQARAYSKHDHNRLKRSRYPEDEFVHGHTLVWGSYYAQGKWGFKCCRSLDRNSSCTRQ